MAFSEKKWGKDAEAEIYTQWKEKDVYRFDAQSSKPVYSIDTPPPYLNTPIHIGHATTYTLMDMFARFKRMKGFNVLFPLGLDNNGLPIEMAAEKKFNVRFHQLSREDFLQKCRQVLEAAGTASIDSFMRLGIGFNSWKRGTQIGEIYATDSPEYRSFTQATFIDLWNKGLIYEEERINNYCPGCRTTVADAEIDYAELQSSWNEIVFTVKETGEKIIIGTTRPELLASCLTVIFNPADERYQHLAGKTALTPLYNRPVPIMAHAQASMEKGTGLVMMCTAGDTADIRFAREVGLSPVISINVDGTMNDNAEFLKGMRIKDARAAIINRLKSEGLLVKQTPAVHRTPVCDRSGDPIEFIAMKEFYLKQLDFKADLLKIAHELNIFAPQSRQILLDWINSVSIDWPISRRRYYATEIPLWYCKQCRFVVVPPKGKYYQPWKEAPPVVEKCSKCGSTDFEGETRVLDTWFDSSNTPLYILQYSSEGSEGSGFFKKNFPATVRPQGKEIVRTWLYYTLLKGYLLTGRSVFRDVWIHYHVVDEQGKKMSKRTGNVIDPHTILEKYGAEPFRLWAAVEGNMTTQDFRCSFERIEGAGKTVVKLWNIARFITLFPQPQAEAKQQMAETDKWILAELDNLVRQANEGYEKYEFHAPVTAMRHFIWETFASHYIELVKNRAYNQDGLFSTEEQAAAVTTLHHCLHTLLKLLAPVLPLITYRIYKDMTGKDIHFEEFPLPPDDSSKMQSSLKTEELVELNSAIWKAKREKGLSLKAEIKEATIPDQFQIIEKDVKSTHTIAKISYGKELKFQFS